MEHFFSRMDLAEKLRESLKGFLIACFVCFILLAGSFLSN